MIGTSLFILAVPIAVSKHIQSWTNRYWLTCSFINYSNFFSLLKQLLPPWSLGMDNKQTKLTADKYVGVCCKVRSHHGLQDQQMLLKSSAAPPRTMALFRLCGLSFGNCQSPQFHILGLTETSDSCSLVLTQA